MRASTSPNPVRMLPKGLFDWLQEIRALLLSGSFYIFYLTFRENSHNAPAERGLDGCEQPQGLPGLKLKLPRIHHLRPLPGHRAAPDDGCTS
jgi:hypothetical protein